MKNIFKRDLSFVSKPRKNKNRSRFLFFLGFETKLKSLLKIFFIEVKKVSHSIEFYKIK